MLDENHKGDLKALLIRQIADGNASDASRYGRIFHAIDDYQPAKEKSTTPLFTSEQKLFLLQIAGGLFLALTLLYIVTKVRPLT